ncbi:hypothetical protein ZTR_00722 [Talaromyces verruculosus]|nr:hypothetical protein ZTR_00722 [Talaromyces verruculosus]
MATKNTPIKRRFTPFVHFHKYKIIPLLGDEKIADSLIEEFSDEDIYEYEKLNDQPAGIKAELKAHQLDGISFLYWLRRNNAHGILGDEMGLGKTLQILSFFQLIKNTEKDDRPFLVISPLSVLDSWESESLRWTTMKTVKYHGNSEKRQMIAKMLKNKEADIVLITYETVVLDIHRVSRMANWKCVACDEGHRLKNSTKQLSASIRKLKTDTRLVLTGTPIQNNLSEVWSLLNWLYPEVFIDETNGHFKDAFSLTDGRVDFAFLGHVRSFLETIMLRRTKESTTADLQLPKKNDVIMYLPLTETQKRLYLEILTGSLEQGDFCVDHNENDMLVTPPPSPGSANGNYSQLSASQVPTRNTKQSMTNVLMELRKICIHSLFVVDWDNFDARLDNNMASLIHGSTKFIVLKRLIEEEVIKNNKKILIFSGFDYALDCCEALVATMGVPSLRLDGNTCYATRKYNIHRFQNLPQNKVFIMATRAGGEGITLTAAEVVVFMDSDWNPQVTAQAEARAYRIGQTRPVTVYKLCTRGTVEEQMQNRVNKKLYLASKIIDNFMNTNSDRSQSDSIESDSKFVQNLIRQDQRASKMTTLDADDMLIMDWKSILNLSKKTPNDEEEDDVHSSSSPPLTPHTASFNEDESTWLSRNERVRTNLFEGKVFLRFREQRKPELLTDLDLFNRRLNKNRVVYDESIDYFITKESTLCKKGEAVPTLTASNSTKVEEVGKVKFQHLKCIDGELQEYQDLGYESPQHIQYVTCENCVKKEKEKHSKRATTSIDTRLLRSVKRPRRFDFE